MDLVMPQDGGQSGLPNPKLMERLYEGGDLLGAGSAGTPPISDIQVWTLTHTRFTGSLGYRLKGITNRNKSKDKIKRFLGNAILYFLKLSRSSVTYHW